MNPQINFIMNKSDEEKFLDFLQNDANCTLIKVIALPEDDPYEFEELSYPYARYYYIIGNDIPCDIEYETTKDDTGNTIKTFVSYEKSRKSKPIIEYMRKQYYGEWDSFPPGRLRIDTDIMTIEYRSEIMKKYAQIKKWIIKNSIARLGDKKYYVYIFQEAWNELIKHEQILQDGSLLNF